MKKIKLIGIFLVVVVFSACSNVQNSSLEEARYAVEHLPDFREFVQYFSVESDGFLFPAKSPKIYQADPKLGGEVKITFIHEVIYKTKDGRFKLVLMNDSRPPKIVATKEFK